MGFINLSEGLEIGKAIKDTPSQNLFSSGVEIGSLFESALEQISKEEYSYRESVSNNPLNTKQLTVTGVLKRAVQDVSGYVDKTLSNIANSPNNVDVGIGSSIYEYSISDDIPVYMDKDRDKLYKEIESIREALSSTTTTKEKIETINKNRKSTIRECDSSYWNKYRGKLIRETSVKSDEYGRELFKVYRSNGKRIQVTEQTIKDAKKHIKNKSAINQVMKEKKNIIKQYDMLQEKFDQLLNLRNVRNLDNHAEDLQLEMDMYFTAKANQLNKMKNLHLIAYTAKLDAIVEQYKIEQSLARLEV